MDNMIIMKNDDETIQDLKVFPHKQFSIKDLAVSNTFFVTPYTNKTKKLGQFFILFN